MWQLGALIEREIDSLIELRHILHQHAELSWNETQTTAILREQVEKWGFRFRGLSVTDTGGYVDLISSEGLPFLLFRADIDALPLEDNSLLSYASLNKGISHACGHDFHSAVGLGIIKLFPYFKNDFNYNIRVLFQPAEEPIPSGGSLIVNSELMQTVKAAFAVHVEPSLPSGTISWAKGWVNTRSNVFKLKLKGKGGHSARVTRDNHLIGVAAEMITESIAYIKNGYDPNWPSVLAFTGIDAGDAVNVLPDTLNLRLTYRITRTDDLQILKDFFDEYAEMLKKNFNVLLEYNTESGAPPVIISGETYNKLEDIYSHHLNGQIALENFRSPGGDDFGWYLSKLPGALVRIGMQDDKHNISLHQKGFDANDKSLATALKAILTILKNW